MVLYYRLILFLFTILKPFNDILIINYKTFLMIVVVYIHIIKNKNLLKIITKLLLCFLIILTLIVK